MSRYIDFDYVKTKKRFNMKSGHHFVWMQDIYSAPSIDIVHCEECKHWNEEDHWCNIRDSYGWDYKADDFCSYGCREEE